MSEIEKKPIKITETVLRDAHQSLIATRMPTEFMLPIVDKMDKVGYHSVECWGGATFDASLRFLKEDPWDRLRKLRDGFKNTKLQMLFRGQNILGYRPYADDVVDYFVQKSISNGIDIIRIFDCLNDLRNLQEAVNATNKFKAQEGRGEAQVALAYTLGDAYTLEYWTSMPTRKYWSPTPHICPYDRKAAHIHLLSSRHHVPHRYHRIRASLREDPETGYARLPAYRQYPAHGP